MPEGGQQIAAAVAEELNWATQRFGSFASAHEGYAVILEELDELWEEVCRKTKSPERMRAEAIQVAAMAERFILDVCPADPPATDEAGGGH